MSVLHWRMPVPGETPARLTDVTVAEVAEALEAARPNQRRLYMGDELLAIFSVTADFRPITVFLTRADDSFVWCVLVARPMNGDEFEKWFEGVDDGRA